MEFDNKRIKKYSEIIPEDLQFLADNIRKADATFEQFEKQFDELLTSQNLTKREM
jgi:hypothetical protein